MYNKVKVHVNTLKVPQTSVKNLGLQKNGL